MSKPVATVGSRFEGFCSACRSQVGGSLVTGSFVAVEGRPVCVTGSSGRGDCGHPCTAVGLSAVWSIGGKAVARAGDPVTGVIEGRITTGSDFVATD